MKMPKHPKGRLPYMASLTVRRKTSEAIRDKPQLEFDVHNNKRTGQSNEEGYQGLV